MVKDYFIYQKLKEGILS